MEEIIMLPSVYSNISRGFFPSLFNDFDSFFNGNLFVPQSRHTSPAVNVIEDDKAYKVEVAAPGMSKDDFKLSLDKQCIMIDMEKRDEKKEADEAKKYIRREFSYSKYEQRLMLPDNVEVENISAEMKDGVLCIEIPKRVKAEQSDEVRRIEIK